ncbi:helix-turn-helix transcriptional regulator [Okibacterium fritillariae]|uniref:helix-turn-helix transcriptional regulator n=1 Tax=Okibacterium fritillariae TaxID=123320 RepID=UPI0040555995
MATPTSRLLTLLSLLQARRDWPGALLAERLDISHRTVRRDIDRLREMGYRIEATMGPDGGYRLDAGEQLPPLLFDDDQVIALVVALRSAPLLGAGTEEAALRALTTVRQVMPSRLRHRVDALNFTTLGRRASRASPGTDTGAVTDAVTPDVLVALSSAARAHEVLRFDHGSDASSRRVEPHHLVASNGLWYLVAWDLDREDWRIFRADRVTPRIPTGPRFSTREVPGGDAAAFVSARFKGSAERDEWPCTGTVVVHRPAAEVAPFAADGMVTDLGDGRCTLVSGSWSWVALAAALGRFDARIDVLHPPELAAAFGTLAARNAQTAGANAARAAPAWSRPPG